jgi:hypothetical protein
VHDVDGTETLTVGKLQAGYTRYIATWTGLRSGIGVSASAGFAPGVLETVYGARVNPGFGVFFSVRPAVMQMAGAPHVH